MDVAQLDELLGAELYTIQRLLEFGPRTSKIRDLVGKRNRLAWCKLAAAADKIAKKDRRPDFSGKSAHLARLRRRPCLEARIEYIPRA